MKKKVRVKQQRAARALLARRYVFGFALACSAGWGVAADADATSFEGPEGAGSNWVEFGLGGMFTSGNQSQAEAARRQPEGVVGGIQDLHYQTEIAKNTVLSLDGHGLYDWNDYRLNLGLKKEETYYLKFGLENFRTWSSADGGYYPLSGDFYGANAFGLGSDALVLDRGAFTFEGGLMLKNLPQVRFKYSHLYREGEKASTIWGVSHPGLINPTAGLVPTALGVDESRHIFELDLTHRIKQTEVGVGAVYEFGDLNQSRRMWQFPNEGALAGERRITQREATDYDLFNVHGFAENWLKPNLFLSVGYMFSDLHNDTAGSRIWGDDFDVAFTPNAANGQGYTNLLSTARKQEHVLNLNLMHEWSKTLVITPSVRVQRQDWDDRSRATPTYGNTIFAARDSETDADAIEVRERIDVRYSGVTNWVFTARGEWAQGQGNLTESGGLFNNISTPGDVLTRDTEETRFFQKYSLGAKWYATRRLSVDVGGYYKRNEYDYDHSNDSTTNAFNQYPAFLTLHDFATHDGHVRLTWRVRPNLTLMSRYEYQLTTVDTGAGAGLGTTESARMTSHILAQNVSWAPWARVYFQAGFNLVDSTMKTPVTDETSAVLKAQNNYWSLNFNTGLVLDDKTDLNLGYTYYRADNFSDNTPAGVPLGSGAEEHGVTATLTRRLTKNLRTSLRYGYYNYADDSSGGARDYEAHIVFTTLQYRF